VITFGFSAFLKLLSLNDKPQQTEIRRRFAPSGGGYDFHDSLRRLAHHHLVDDKPMTDVLASAATIAQAPERLSATAGLERLALWRAENPGPALDFPPVTFESPGHLFRVKFEPDFGLALHSKPTALHLWNTKKPPLAPAAVYIALSLIAQKYEGLEGAPEDLGVLSLREPVTLHLQSEAADWSGVAASIVDRIEEAIEGPAPPPPAPGQHPTP
jgi:hypothetical protein